MKGNNPYFRVWDTVQKKAVPMHRMAAETALGRLLESGECVHHINGDKHDNRAVNLEILPSVRHHAVAHALEIREKKGIVPLFDRETILKVIEK